MASNYKSGKPYGGKKANTQKSYSNKPYKKNDSNSQGGSYSKDSAKPYEKREGGQGYSRDSKPYGQGGGKNYSRDSKPYEKREGGQGYSRDSKPYGQGGGKNYSRDSKPYEKRDGGQGYSRDSKPYGQGGGKNHSRDSKPYEKRDGGQGYSRDAKPFGQQGGYGESASNYNASAVAQVAVVQPEQEELFENMLEGRNPVKEAIRAGREIERILISNGPNDGSVREIAAEARKNGVLVQETERIRLDKISKTGVHQGIIAFVAAKEYCEVSDILEYAASKGEDPFVFILDGITDPQNLGSVLRSAECAGVHGVIIPKRRAVGLTPVVAKASAGAIEYMRVAKVTNISQTIEQLKKSGIWIFGASMEGERIAKTNMCGPLAIVIGAEGDGLSQNVRNHCDRVVALPVKGQIDSLNAAVSAAVFMYEAVRQREGKEIKGK